MTKPILTIIPTSGRPELRQAVESALPASDVLLVTDGPRGEQKCGGALYHGQNTPGYGAIDFLHVPFKVGGGEWAGHRIYAAVPHLVNHEFVAFLDEDNWYEPEHLPAMLDALAGSDVAWSYRNIVDKAGTFICRDECESLGPHHLGVERRWLVDTSCWAFRTEALRSFCGQWDGGWGQDSRFTEHMKAIASHSMVGTGLYSLNYRLGGSERSPKAEFFLQGNERMKACR